MKTIIYFLLLLVFAFKIFATEKDTLREYKLGGVEIVKERFIPFEKSYLFNPDYQSEVFSKEGLNLVRRGGVLTQDVYFDGFKRNDISITVDGEMIQCACPNRMDAPITRINIVEMEGIKITKTTTSTNSNLYGKIEFNRKELTNDFKVRTLISGNLVARNDYDLQIFGEGLNTGITVRYSYGSPYKNADKKGFDSLYGYNPAPPDYRYFTSSIRHSIGNFEVGVGASISKDVLFPYLRMDERKTNFFTGFVKFKDNKLYINYTSHLMNNGLRSSWKTMEMETDAKNLTIGLSGKYFDVVARRWDADNYVFSKMMNKKFTNRALPGIWDIFASGNYNFDLKFVNARVRLGIANSSYSDDTVLSVHKNYDAEAKKSRFFLLGALNFSKSIDISNDIKTNIMAEVSTISPSPEQLYITIRRPNQNWIGNSNLKQTVKSNVSLEFSFVDYFEFGFSGNYLWNYVLPVPDTVAGQQPRVTYKNVKATLLSSYLKFHYEWFSSELNFFWGENQDNKKPLPEIAPLTWTNTINFPTVWNFTVSVYHRWENAQKRVDLGLRELPSSAWNTVGISIAYDWKPFRFVLDVDNLLNHNYSRYLSFARDPYSAGIKVFDPGRTISFRILFDQNF
ncbi:MAG: hypothetical protein WHV60_05945 [Bacteroidota bacterium]